MTRLKTWVATALIGLAAPHAAGASGYTLAPLTGANTLGSFYPAVLLDTGVALGTLIPAGSSHSTGLTAFGTTAVATDYCAALGEPGLTAVTAASANYIAGTCDGGIDSFVHDNRSNVTTQLWFHATTGVTGVNDAGLIVGDYTTELWPIGFYYFLTGFQTVNPYASTATMVSGVSTLNTIFGYYIDLSDIGIGFMLDQFGHYKYVRAPGQFTHLTGLNGHNAASGYYVDTAGGNHAFAWKGGKFTYPALPNSLDSVTSGINSKGVIAGNFTDTSGQTHGYTWFPLTGGLFIFDAPPGSFGLSVTSVNNQHAQVTGFYKTGTVQNPTTVSFIATCSGRCF